MGSGVCVHCVCVEGLAYDGGRYEELLFSVVVLSMFIRKKNVSLEDEATKTKIYDDDDMMSAEVVAVKFDMFAARGVSLLEPSARSGQHNVIINGYICMYLIPGSPGSKDSFVPVPHMRS